MTRARRKVSVDSELNAALGPHLARVWRDGSVSIL